MYALFFQYFPAFLIISHYFFPIYYTISHYFSKKNTRKIAIIKKIAIILCFIENRPAKCELDFLAGLTCQAITQATHCSMQQDLAPDKSSTLDSAHCSTQYPPENCCKPSSSANEGMLVLISNLFRIHYFLIIFQLFFII